MNFFNISIFQTLSLIGALGKIIVVEHSENTYAYSVFLCLLLHSPLMNRYEKIGFVQQLFMNQLVLIKRIYSHGI